MDERLTFNLLFSLLSNRAFSNPSHHANLDHIFALLFDLLLGEPDNSTPVAFSASSLPGLPTAPQLKIPADVRVSAAAASIDSYG